MRIPRDLSGLAACRIWIVESENRPHRAQFLPDLQPNSPAIGQKYGEKCAAAVDLQPTTSKSDRLLELAQKLEQLGYRVTRQTGSHMRLSTQTKGAHHIIVPRHDLLRIGTLAAIIDAVAKHQDMSRNALLGQLLN